MNANINVDNALKTGSLLEKTESEQLNITDKTDKEQAEQVEQEEQIDEEQAEQDAAEQAELQSKINDIDAKIEQYRINAVQARKEQAMKKFNYDEGQIEKYISFIDGETVEEIESSVLKLTDDIAPNNYFGDPSINNGAAAKPKAVDKREIGRNAVKRIMSKIRL